MSINTEGIDLKAFEGGLPEGLPDPGDLEKLANSYFKSVPGQEPRTEFSRPSEGGEAIPGYAKEPHFTVNNPVTSLTDTNYLPELQSSAPGSAGLGISSAAVTPGFRHYLLPETLTGTPESYLPGDRYADYPGKAYQAAAGVAGEGAGFYFLSEALVNPFRSDLAARGLCLDPAGHVGQTGETPLLDVRRIREDFPILKERVNGKQLVWFDNAATTQKPQQVIDRISYFYAHENSNIHRGAHELAARSTDAYEEARETVRGFLNAASVNEIVFVRGATEAINLVAKSWGEQNLQEGDEIIVSHLEHHANIVPWQQLAQKKGLKLKVIPVDDHGQLLLDEYARLLSPRTRLVAFTQVSNALGTVTPAQQVIALAHQAGAKVLLDGAQSVSHLAVDVQSLNPDWFVFSGHKIFGPTGIGVLYGKEELLNSTQPWQGGGNMIRDVTFERTEYHRSPGRFEAGTGNIADAVGLGAALKYVQGIGIGRIHAYEDYLLKYATGLLKDVPGIRLVGTAEHKASVLSFTLKGYTNDEVGQALNREGIAVRTGHHCAQPVLRRFGLESTVRPSLAFYNTTGEVDSLVSVLYRLRSNRNLL